MQGHPVRSMAQCSALLEQQRNRLLIAGNAVDVAPSVNDAVPGIQKKRMRAVDRRGIARHCGIPGRRARRRDGDSGDTGPEPRRRNVVVIVVR